MKRIAIYLLFLIFPLSAGAQQPDVWTLERCIAHALEKNIDVKIQRNLEQKAVFDRKQSQWALLPSLGASASEGFNFGRAANQYNDITSGSTYNMSYGLSSSLNLFSGFTSLNAVAANRFNELACTEATNLAKNTLVIGIIGQFSQVLCQKALIAVAKEKLDVSLAESERIAATIEAGQMEPVAQDEINATVSGNQLELSRAENQYRLLRLQLAQLIEIPGDSEFEVSAAGLEVLIPENSGLMVDSVYVAACRIYPSILQREYELQWYRKMLKISKGNLAPSLTVSGGYYSGFYSTDTLPNGQQSPVGTQFKEYLNPSLGLSLNIPFLNGRSRDFAVKKSRIDVENALFNLENQKKQIRREIEDAVLRLEAFSLEYRNASDHLVYARKSFETNREKYRLGMINTTDFMTAQNQLSLAESNLLQARYSWIVQRRTIELYSGIQR